MGTKKEMEETNMKLRELLTAAQLKIKELTAEKEPDTITYKNKAVGAFFNNEKMEWSIAELEFDLESKKARVTSTRNVGRSYDMVEYRIKEFLAEKILLPILREKK